MSRKEVPDRVKRSFDLDRSVHDRLLQYYPIHGDLARLVRDLLAKHLYALEQRARERASAAISPAVLHLLED
jgi:hypothetical protein